MKWVRYIIARWKLRREFRHLDRALADARRKHKPTRQLIAAKTAALHHALGLKG